jgi:hypothetical protein
MRQWAADDPGGRTPSYGGTSQGAVSVGNYAITPGGLYSGQQGYIISYDSGTLSIDRLSSVAWVGGARGDRSKASNWAGGAIRDFADVAEVVILSGRNRHLQQIRQDCSYLSI